MRRNGNGNGRARAKQHVRCAIYTRKSTDGGCDALLVNRHRVGP